MREKTFKELARRLTALADGLVFISESDYPVRLFVGSEVARPQSRVVDQIRETAVAEPFEEVDFDEFFDRLTTPWTWHAEIQKKRAATWAALRQLMTDNLVERSVLRVGRVRIRILVVGRAPSGRVIGVATEAVETG